jgi:hypothetical protein
MPSHRMTNYWMIKWHKDGDYHQNRKRIWLDFLKSPSLTGKFSGYEFDHPNRTVTALYHLVQVGDVVFCYQVDRRAE